MKLLEMMGLVNGAMENGDNSPAVKAANELIDLVKADAKAGGPIGSKLAEVLKLGADLSDPIYKDVGAMERQVIVPLVKQMAKGFKVGEGK